MFSLSLSQLCPSALHSAQFDKGSKHQASLDVVYIKGVTREYTGKYGCICG